MLDVFMPKICAALRIENVYHTAKSHYGVGADGRA